MASWIATRPMFALIILIILLVLASGISAKIVRDKMLKEKEIEIRMEKKALEEREREYRQQHEAALRAVKLERDRLKARLGDLEKRREEIEPPKDVNELISRFRALGY